MGGERGGGEGELGDNCDGRKLLEYVGIESKKAP